MTRARARRTDPEPSHDAARQAERTTAETQRMKCFAAVVASPGSSSAEIARQTGLDRHAAARRLPELRERGLLVNGPMGICTESGKMAITWMVAKPSEVGQKTLF
jgi:predicted HTH transcriptional regulator